MLPAMSRPGSAGLVEPLRPDDPRQLGRYRIVAVLGEGGMGRVLLGVTPDGRLAAVKQVHPRGGFRARFEREVAASRRLTGAYTAAVLDAELEVEHPWLATAFISGPSLGHAVTAAGVFPEPALHRLAAGLALALAEIHRAGLVHRDLNPGNVVLTDDGLRVIDFGIVGLADGTSDLTETASALGVPGHFSPEQAEGRTAGAASDIFALGTLLVLAATGTNPFTAATAPQTLYRVVHHHPDLRVLPPELRRIAEHCLDKNPARRPTAADILRDLPPIHPSARPWPEIVHGAIAEQRMRIQTCTHRVPAPRRRGRRIALVTAAVAALITGGTVGVAAITSGSEQPPPPAQPAAAVTPTLGPPPADPLTLAVQRNGAGCPLLDENGFTVDRSVYAISPFGYCYYLDAAGTPHRLKLGNLYSPYLPDGIVEGLPLEIARSDTGSCSAAVALPNEPRLSLDVLSTAASQDVSCEGAKTLLGASIRALRSGRTPQPDSRSLATVDPCSTPDAATMNQLFGSVTTTPSGRFHCRWTGTDKSVEVSFFRDELEFGVEGNEERVDLAGRTVYQRYGSPLGQPNCTLSWPHLELADGVAEHVKLEVRLPDGVPDQVCSRAREVGQVILSGLPTP